MTHDDASYLVRETAKSIERGQLVLSEDMRKASPEYSETYRKNIPQLLNLAADLLDAAGQLLEADANPDSQKEERPKPISVSPDFWAAILKPKQKAMIDRKDREIEQNFSDAVRLERELVQKINRNFESDDQTLISFEFSTVNVNEEPGQVSHEASVLGEDTSGLQTEVVRP